jgi:superfamily I DNA/RNA helicase
VAIEIKSGDILSNKQLEQHMKIYAGPGAGKTHFLVENIKNIIVNNKKITGSENKKVLCITYTNAAVDEIKRRLVKYSDNVAIYTIHGFIIEYIIKPYQTELKKHILNDFGIEIDSEAKISSQIEGLSILHGHDRDKIYDYIKSESGTDSVIDYSKNAMGKVEIDILKYCETDVAEIVKSSKIKEEHKMAIKKYVWSKAKKLTHNEILYFGYKIANSNSTISYALRVQFPFIFVDEFQDTNPLQAKLVEHLGKKSIVVGVIGDIAQSIYSFQGARPSKFDNFKVSGSDINEYNIIGNRRSTANIVHMCNYIRKSDTLVQLSIKEYKNQDIRSEKESIKVKFICGESKETMCNINQIVQEGGVVLTRAWAASFEYMNGISYKQKNLLKRIYNSYYISPIDIRADISEHTNVTWVRAFRFILSLWDAFQTKSVVDILKAFDLYIDTKKIVKDKVLNIKVLVKLGNILGKVFKDIDEDTKAVDIINKFNEELNLYENNEIPKILSNEKKTRDASTLFKVLVFSKQDKDDLKENVSALEWNTAYMLFNKVFSPDSHYMTVHQAKSLEWEKVIVSLKPVRFDNTEFINMFTNPQILRDTERDEFTRMFFVACSRAKEDLYIHVKNPYSEIEIMKKELKKYCELNSIDKFYEFA